MWMRTRKKRRDLFKDIEDCYQVTYVIPVV